MANKETIITLKVEASKANKSVEGLDKNIDKAKKSTKDLNKESKKTPKLLKAMKGGIKGIGTALKAAGIGIVVALLAKFGEVLSRNQKAVDFFNKAITTLETVFTDLFSLFSNSIDPVKEFFTDLFENPQENIKAFGKLIKDNIIERFTSAIKTFGLAGKAIRQFFEGDFSGAADTAKQAGKEFIDVTTGVDDSFNKIGTGVKDTINAISEYAVETYNTADALVELRKQQRLQEARLRGITLEYQNQQETFRQIRDDERNSIDERIKANEDLAQSLIEQGKVEKGIINDRISLIQQEIANGDTSIEKQEELINAKNDLVDIEERINGFRSEQQINENALQKEREENLKQLQEIGKTEEELAKQELKNQLEDRKKLIEVTVETEEEKNKLLLEAQKQYNESLVTLEDEKQQAFQDVINKYLPEDEVGLSEAEKFKLERERKREQFEIELEDLEKSEEEKAKLLAKFDNQTKTQRERINEEEVKGKKAVEATKVDLVANAVGNISQYLEEGSTLAKGFAVAEALYNTYLGITEGLKAPTLPQRIAEISFASITGFGAVDNILGTPENASNGGGRGTVVSANNSSPRFDVVGDSQRLRDIDDQEDTEPQEVFVVSKKVTSQQELDRNRQNNSRFI